jgi:DNA-binding NtrC family response regulator
MQEEVKKGSFREDLYFRLNVITVDIPALRERHDDIRPLAEYFIEKYSKANGVPARKLSDAGLEKLIRYSWPGNVRELENAMHRSVLLATGNIIDPEAIMLQHQAEPQLAIVGGAMAKPASGNTGGLVGRTVDSVEQELIIDTLNYCLGNRTHAANILGISIRTLRNKLKQYGEHGAAIPPPPTGTE